MTVKVKDLQNQSDNRNPPVLYCASCGSTWSAHAGDYFMLPAEHVFKCCRRNMKLGVMERIFRTVD
jgi:hypothetical protein